jgi:hypothetical protein
MSDRRRPFVVLLSIAAALLTAISIYAWYSFNINVVIGMLFFGAFPKPAPEIARGMIVDSDGRHLGGNSTTKIAAAIAKTFPIGSSEANMIAKLQQQGFVFPDPPPKDCWPRDKPIPDRIAYKGVFMCPAWDWHHTLNYGWGTFPCGEEIWVHWKADTRGRVSWLDSSYDSGCL